MATRFYPAVFTAQAKGDGGGFVVTFPDIPGCIADGDTLEECYANAKDVLQAMLDSMQEHGDPIPEPTPLAITAAKQRRGKGIATVQLVEGQVEGGKAIKLSITMDEELVKLIDARAGNRGRSGFLAQGARALLHQGGKGALRRRSKSA